MNDQQKIDIIEDFILYVKEQLGIEQLPNVKLVTDQKFATSLRSFGIYKPETLELYVYISNRNTADILRTLAHELVHHRQNELGMLQPYSGETGSPHENQANSFAGELLRNYGKKQELIYEAKIIKKNPSKYQIYCDMDGVICDFDKQFEKYFKMNPEEYKDKVGKKEFYKVISEKGEEFWNTMPWMPEGKTLWDKIKNHSPIIVTSPGTFSGSKEGKLIWIEKNLKPAPKAVKFEQAGEKQNVLKGKSKEEIKKSVLIDDYDKNINAWKAVGGKTIKENPGKPAHNHIED
jgi:Zn-dependent peptidase ImmA (M78 family)